MHGTRLCQLVGLAGILLLFLVAFTPLPNALRRWLRIPAQLAPAEAIVVLGGGVSPDGMLSASSLRRALQGIMLYRQGLAPLLVFLGPGSPEGPVEADTRAALAHQLGVAPAAILTETGARTTREEAIRVAALLRPRGIRRMLLVTDAHHLRRAQPLFAHVGFEVLAAPVEDLSNAATTPEGRLALMRLTLEELAAELYYWIAGYL